MSLEASKFVVLRAKDILTHLPRASRISRDEFISICLTASKEFLRRKMRRSGAPNLAGTASWMPSSSDATTPRSPRAAGGAGGGGSRHFFSQRDENLLRELLLGELALALDHSNKNPPHAGVPEIPRSGGTTPRNASTPADTAPRITRQSQNTGGGGGNTSIVPGRERFPRHHSSHHHWFTTHLHPIQIESVQLIKEHIDPSYHRGSLSAEQYSTVVLSILREAFQHPLIAPLIDASCTNPHRSGGGGVGGPLEDQGARVRASAPIAGVAAAFEAPAAADERTTLTETAAPATLLPPLLRSVLIDMATAVAQHYDLIATTRREEAERLSHDARGAVGTHSPSIRPHHHHHHHHSLHEQQSSTPTSSQMIVDGAGLPAMHSSANASQGSPSPRQVDAAGGEAARELVLVDGEKSIARHIEEDEEEFNAQLAKLRAIMKDPPPTILYSAGEAGSSRQRQQSASNSEQDPVRQVSSRQQTGLSGSSRSKAALEAELEDLRQQMLVLQHRMMTVARELAECDDGNPG